MAMLMSRRERSSKEDQQNAKHTDGKPPVASLRNHPLQTLHNAEYSAQRRKNLD